jgi:hypothetical protein
MKGVLEIKFRKINNIKIEEKHEKDMKIALHLDKFLKLFSEQAIKFFKKMKIEADINHKIENGN